MKLYQRIAQLVDAMKNCHKAGNKEWYFKHHANIEKLVMDHLPRGSGFDNGTKFVFRATPDPEKLTFQTSFHHMNDNGYYTGWSDHEVIVTGSLPYGYSVRVTGKNREGIKDYITETFHYALNTEVGDYE